MTTRTQDEIRDRLNAVRDDDMFGWRTEVLIQYLDYDHIAHLIKPGSDMTAETWNDDVKPTDRDTVLSDARGYLDFALTKALGHRGISASRSVVKLSEWAWLLGHDDVAERMTNDRIYPMFGAPVLALFAETIDHRAPDMDTDEFRRMARGERCSDDCYEC